jgi:DNA-binding GntR family transcriptional regulator
VTTPLTNSEIYERIYTAISERRLLPGTKLSEERLAQAFMASRTRIREVLMRLSQELVIELHTNRGAFVASPSPRDLRDIFTVRRALEKAVAVDLCTHCPEPTRAVLRQHVERELQAQTHGDRVLLSQLSGEFHVRLAEATGNRLFSDNLRRLVALTGLAIAQYETLVRSSCSVQEHEDLLSAIEAGDARQAERLVLDHLNHMEQSIQPPTSTPTEIDFEQIFQTGAPIQSTAPARRASTTAKTPRRLKAD